MTQRGLTKPKRKKLDSFEQKDEVWAIFDRDEHPEYKASVQKCETNGIGVARSNPCFEVWLILHFEDYEKATDRHAVQRHFSTFCNDYDPQKRKTTNFNELMPATQKAEERAERQLQNRSTEGDPFGAPSTTVFELIKAIKSGCQRSKVAPSRRFFFLQLTLIHKRICHQDGVFAFGAGGEHGTGHSMSSSMRRTYLTASAGKSAQERAPSVDCDQPGMVS